MFVKGQCSARAQDPPDFSQHRSLVRDAAQDEAGHDDVDARIGGGDVFRGG
jgi:hypothetical protein